MASWASPSLKQTISSYINTTNDNAELDRAKQDFTTIKEFLSENLQSKKKKLAVNYCSVKSSPHLAGAMRLSDACFDLIVVIQENGVIVESSSGPGCFKLSGLSPSTLPYNVNGGKAVQTLCSDVQRCLSKLIKTKPDFAGRFATQVNVKTLNCEIIVYEQADPPTKSAAVPSVNAKAAVIVPPWFCINVKPVVRSHAEKCYMPTTMPGPVWIEYREDPLDVQTKPVRALLQALLASKPYLRQHSTHDIAASAVALYTANTSKTSYQVDWSNVEQGLVGVLHELEKAYRCCHLPYYSSCTLVNLLQTAAKRRRKKMTAAFSQLMLHNCQEANEILISVVGRVSEE